MGILSEISDWIIRVLDGGPSKEKELETDITKFADIPRLDCGLLQTLFPAKGKRRQILVCVTHESFENLDYEAQEARLAKIDYEKYRNEAWSDSLSFSSMSSKYKERGFLVCGAERIGFGLIELTDCIHEGDRGDSDGYGVEPDTWIKAYANLKGEIVSPFALSDTELNINVENWLKLKINPVGEDGKIKICPYDKVHKAHDLEGYFIVEKDGSEGLIDRKMNLIIPLDYQMIHGDENGLVWVKMHNNLCGITDLNNHFIIPAMYDSLYYINKGEYDGFYEAVLNNTRGIIDCNNKIIKPFRPRNN
jgi:hypothetical protein